MFGVGQTSSAQIIRTNPQVKPTPPQVRRTPPPAQKPIVFKGTGVMQKNPEVVRFGQSPQAPRSLTGAEKSAAFKEVMLANQVVIENENFPVETYVTLSAQTPCVAGKGNLSLDGTFMVDP